MKQPFHWNCAFPGCHVSWHKFQILTRLAGLVTASSRWLSQFLDFFVSRCYTYYTSQDSSEISNTSNTFQSKKDIFSQKVRSLKIWGHSIWWHCGTILCSINFPHFTGSQRLFWNRIPQIKDIFPHKKWVKVMFKTHQPENHWRNQHFQFGSLWLDWPRRFTGNRVTLLLLKTIGWSYLLSIFQKSLEHQRLDDAKTL